jgi:hypothetical protein
VPIAVQGYEKSYLCEKEGKLKVFGNKFPRKILMHEQNKTRN